MATVEITQESFDTIMEQGIVLLDWWAAWCGPCRGFAPTFERASEQHPDIVFGKVDTDARWRLSYPLDPDADGLSGRNSRLRAARGIARGAAGALAQRSAPSPACSESAAAY